MKLVAYILIGLAVMAAGFTVLSAIAAFFFIPIELADRLFFGTAMLATSGILVFVARSIYIHFIAQRND